MQENENKYKGYSLFNDVSCYATRCKSRGTVLCNIIEDNLTNGEVTRRTLSVARGYLHKVPKQERKVSIQFMEQVLKERGWDLPTVH